MISITDSLTSVDVLTIITGGVKSNIGKKMQMRS